MERWAWHRHQGTHLTMRRALMLLERSRTCLEPRFPSMVCLNPASTHSTKSSTQFVAEDHALCLWCPHWAVSECGKHQQPHQGPSLSCIMIDGLGYIQIVCLLLQRLTSPTAWMMSCTSWRLPHWAPAQFHPHHHYHGKVHLHRNHQPGVRLKGAGRGDPCKLSLVGCQPSLGLPATCHRLPYCHAPGTQPTRHPA